jgi:hypothetical protein
MQVANSDEVAVGNVLTVVYNTWDSPIIGYSEERILENDLSSGEKVGEEGRLHSF